MQYEEMTEKRLNVEKTFLKCEFDSLKMERRFLSNHPFLYKQKTRKVESNMIRLDKEITRIDEILDSFRLPLFAKKAEIA